MPASGATGESKPEAKPGVKPEAGDAAMDATIFAGDSVPERPAYRSGFLLGDGAGMGKGRTLAGFVVENIARGRKKHCWVSVSVDLYEDAKRDLRDLGLGNYAEEKCHNLKSVSYEERFIEAATKKKKKGKKGGGGSSSKYDEGGKLVILRAISQVSPPDSLCHGVHMENNQSCLPRTTLSLQETKRHLGWTSSLNGAAVTNRRSLTD